MNSAIFITDGGAWTIERAEKNVFAVTCASGRRGFVEKVGNVYVALRGARYDRSIEVGQTLDFDQAALLLAR